jgi:hypothetical protein
MFKQILQFILLGLNLLILIAILFTLQILTLNNKKKLSKNVVFYVSKIHARVSS